MDGLTLVQCVARPLAPRRDDCLAVAVTRIGDPRESLGHVKDLPGAHDLPRLGQDFSRMARLTCASSRCDPAASRPVPLSTTREAGWKEAVPEAVTSSEAAVPLSGRPFHRPSSRRSPLLGRTARRHLPLSRQCVRGARVRLRQKRRPLLWSGGSTAISADDPRCSGSSSADAVSASWSSAARRQPRPRPLVARWSAFHLGPKTAGGVVPWVECGRSVLSIRHSADDHLTSVRGVELLDEDAVVAQAKAEASRFPSRIIPTPWW